VHVFEGFLSVLRMARRRGKKETCHEGEDGGSSEDHFICSVSRHCRRACSLTESSESETVVVDMKVWLLKLDVFSKEAVLKISDTRGKEC
jgi:hypothetical protein